MENESYGPDPETMADILEESDFYLKVTPSERVLYTSTESSGSYEIFCVGIPSKIFEDRLIKLFIEDYESDELIQFRLMMDPVTEFNRGFALITYASKENAERVRKRLNNFEIATGQKLTIDWSIPDRECLYLKKILIGGKNIDEVFEELSQLTDGLIQVLRDSNNSENCFLQYENEEAAEVAREKLSSDHYRDTVDWSRSRNFPFEVNDVHTCIESSLSDYCTCITQKLNEISALWETVKEAERSVSKEQVKKAREKNKRQYACHSLLMENIDPTNEETINKILYASQYMLDHITDNFSFEDLLYIHKKIDPDIEEKGMIRNKDVFVNGIYNIPSYPSEPARIHHEIEAVVRLLNETVNEINIERTIIKAMTASTDFVLTHPFFDGNGRCSRLIFGATLRKLNMPWIVVPVSDSTRYYEALGALRETDDYTLIYRFMSRCIMRTLEDYLENLRN